MPNFFREGYRVKLVWEDEQNHGSRAQRRSLIPEQEPNRLLLTSDEFRSALAHIETAEADFESYVGYSRTSGLFSAFSASFSRSPSHAPSFLEGAGQSESHEASDAAATGSPEMSQQNYGSDSVASTASILESTNSNHDEDYQDDIERWHVDDADFATLEDFEAGTTTDSSKEKIQPQVRPHLSSASLAERVLLQHWITDLSEMIIPIPRYDNPLRTLFIGLVLAAPELNQGSSGNVALLYALYAISAFNRARISTSSPNDHLEEIGT